MKRFSIIAVDYDRHVPREGMRKGIQSIAAQTFKDFELLICHDGPKQIPYEAEVDFQALGLAKKTSIHATEIRHGDWGHSSRDKLMRLAKGEYFLQFNIDNLLYPHCLERLDAFGKRIAEKIIIFSIHHRKLGVPHFSGITPHHGNIDALQLVAHRDIWKSVGYWFDKRPSSDGHIYQAMCQQYPYAALNEVLGENF